MELSANIQRKIKINSYLVLQDVVSAGLSTCGPAAPESNLYLCAKTNFYVLCIFHKLTDNH
jgi:hypothetical protein